ncbi:UNVERIFIED_CONTAM: hypothetical protein K2H54_051650 [Gekko kuhli]
MAAGKRLRDSEESSETPACKQSKIGDFFAPKSNLEERYIFAVETSNQFSPLQTASDNERELVTNESYELACSMEAITQVDKESVIPGEINEEPNPSHYLLIAKTVECLFSKIRAMEAVLTNLSSEVKKLTFTLNNTTSAIPTSNIINADRNPPCEAQLRKSQPLVGEEALSPPAFPQASSNMGDAPLGGPLSRCQYETNYEMDLDMRSHWVVSTDLSTPTNSKSLADELREADYPLAPQPSTSASNGTLMELEESTPPPIAPAPTKLGLEPDCSRESSLTPSAQDGPEDPLLPLPHVNGNLDNSTEDTLLLSFGTLSAQEQLDIIERLELTKNRLLSLRRNNPHGPPCDQTGLRNSSDSDRGGIRPSSPAQDMLDSRPLPGPNNEILAATDAPEVAARISGSPQVLRNGSVLVDWEQSLNQITELD